MILRFFRFTTAKHAMCLADYSCLFKDSTYHNTRLLGYRFLPGGSYKKKVICRLLK